MSFSMEKLWDLIIETYLLDDGLKNRTFKWKLEKYQSTFGRPISPKYSVDTQIGKLNIEIGL